jgi:hypothetical protein
MPVAVQSLIDTTANNIIRKSNLRANYGIRRIFLTTTKLKQKEQFDTFMKKKLVNLTFKGPCTVIYSYSKTNQIHQFLKLFMCA